MNNNERSLIGVLYLKGRLTGTDKIQLMNIWKKYGNGQIVDFDCWSCTRTCLNYLINKNKYN